MNAGLMRKQLGFGWRVARRQPFQCLIQLTNRCNMRCGFCDFWPNGAPSSAEMTLADYQALNSQLIDLSPLFISIEGGEPFVRRDLTEIVRLFARHHLTVLYTNGWYVEPDNAQALFAAELAQVGVSIDFADAARHDARRGIDGAFERAVRAAQLLCDAAPGGGRQVHIMTVLMEENRAELEPLLALSARLGVGHCVTLLSTNGYRRGDNARLPAADGTLAAELRGLWQRHRHLRVFRDYLDATDDFLAGRLTAPCRAGEQSFNIDHLGNLSACIEKIDRSVGNVRETPFVELLARLRAQADAQGCNDCWTLCRGFAQTLGAGGSARGWLDLATRMRSN